MKPVIMNQADIYKLAALHFQNQQYPLKKHDY